ncbi:hypothetical protein OH76DRAFT_1459245 [Lentinus brumalis]|uniref:Uncharacterized protein n=1 Tax=Lentinus brumalis TaxID=2498619 RepID=A0A371CLN6_9APHY|nr:hypothetical protein OH76DRAFT_1459245 [Polyporus brumalis]
MGSHADTINSLRDHDVFKRIAAYIDRGFKTFQPDLYEYYEDYMGQLRRACPDLRWNFERNVFAAGTFNFGPQSIASVHTNDKNLAFGWCAVMALGDFDPRKGGHLVLWDLKLVMEFPPGTVMFIPSAILRHSNTTIAPGGLFRWVDCGMQTQKSFFEQGRKHTKTGAQRWLDGVGLYSQWERRRRPRK